MTRKTATPPPNLKTILTTENMETAAKVLVGLGVGMVTFAVSRASLYGFIVPTPETGKKNSEGKIIKIFNKLPIGKAVKVLGKWIANDKRALVDIYKTAFDMRKTARYKVSKITDTYSQLLKDQLNYALAQAEEQVAQAEENLAPYLAILQMAQIGLSLAAAGAAYWMLSHADVMKQFILSSEKVAVAAIDETSEVIEGLGSLVDSLIPDLGTGGSAPGSSVPLPFPGLPI